MKLILIIIIIICVLYILKKNINYKKNLSNVNYNNILQSIFNKIKNIKIDNTNHVSVIIILTLIGFIINNIKYIILLLYYFQY